MSSLFIVFFLGGGYESTYLGKTQEMVAKSQTKFQNGILYVRWDVMRNITKAEFKMKTMNKQGCVQPHAMTHNDSTMLNNRINDKLKIFYDNWTMHSIQNKINREINTVNKENLYKMLFGHDGCQSCSMQ